MNPPGRNSADATKPFHIKAFRSIPVVLILFDWYLINAWPGQKSMSCWRAASFSSNR
jgi:hypothetical protein